MLLHDRVKLLEFEFLGRVARVFRRVVNVRRLGALEAGRGAGAFLSHDLCPFNSGGGEYISVP